MGYQDDERERVGRLYREAGMIPTSQRVWRRGRDVTAEPPSTWPWPYSMYVAGGRGDAMRRQYLAWHAEAVVEQGEAPA